LFHAASDTDLPVFYGPGDGVREVAEHYGVYSKILAEAGVQVSQLALSPRRAWEIKTDKGMVIELGREQMEQRLQKFASVYKTTIASLNVDVGYADLRYPNGFAVRKPEQGAAKAPAKVPVNKAAPAKSAMKNAMA
jgi:cell division protein FtsQ